MMSQRMSILVGVLLLIAGVLVLLLNFGLIGPLFFTDTATTEIYTLALHVALPISQVASGRRRDRDLRHRSAQVVSGRRRGRDLRHRSAQVASGRRSRGNFLSHCNGDGTSDRWKSGSAPGR